MSILHVPFYPSDWLAGTRGLTAEETGVYITLIARIYEMAGPIERDDERLFRLCGCKTKARFKASLEYLIQQGKLVEDDGFIGNERAQKEIEKVVGKSDKAKVAAESRWNRKPRKNNVCPHANASPKHMPQPCQLEPELKEEDTGVSSSPSRAVALRAADYRFEEFWDAYPHRGGAKKGKADAQKRWAAAIKARTDPQAIIDGAMRFQRDRQAIDGYAPDPATWLNKKRWTDDVEPPATLTPIEGGRRHDDQHRHLAPRPAQDARSRALAGMAESFQQAIADRAGSGNGGSDQ